MDAELDHSSPIRLRHRHGETEKFGGEGQRTVGPSSAQKNFWPISWRCWLDCSTRIICSAAVQC